MYMLLKDLPGLDAGAEFYWDESSRSYWSREENRQGHHYEFGKDEIELNEDFFGLVEYKT